MMFVSLLRPATAADALPYTLLHDTEKPERIAQNGVRTCFDFKDLRVTADDDIGLGDSIYVSPPSNAECKAGVALGSVAIDSTDSSFLGKIGRYLIIDQGTGPEPRGLVLLVFATRKSVYSDLYDSPIEVRDGVLGYWRPAQIPATPGNCPQYDEFIAGGLTPSIERYVEVDLKAASLARVESARLRCHANQ